MKYSTVNFLVVDPSAPSTLYAGTGGGVFKTTDGGASWTAINTGLTSAFLTVYALAVDPSKPGTLYAGTNGLGIFKTTDGGASWTAANTGLIAPWVSALALDSALGTLYAGTLY